MEQLAMLGETIGTLFLVGAVVGVFYVFYLLLKFTFSAVKDNDD